MPSLLRLDIGIREIVCLICRNPCLNKDFLFLSIFDNKWMNITYLLTYLTHLTASYLLHRDTLHVWTDVVFSDLQVNSLTATALLILHRRVGFFLTVESHFINRYTLWHLVVRQVRCTRMQVLSSCSKTSLPNLVSIDWFSISNNNSFAHLAIAIVLFQTV